MKISKFNVFALFFCFLMTQACNNSSLELESQLRNTGSKLHIKNKKSTPVKQEAFIIYDYKEANAGLQKIRIEMMPSVENPKADIVTAFLTHNHILNQANQVKLIKIEEVGTNTHYYLSSFSDLEQTSTQKLFNKALELTLLRHLKTNNFNIIYNKTAQL